MTSRLCFILTLAALLLSPGCKSMTPGQIGRVQPYSNSPRAGNVYLLRGFIGIWSYGVDHLGAKINESGVRASVYQEDQWDDLAEAIISKYKTVPDREPLILVGHSYGADDTLKIAKKLAEHRMSIDLIITLDPVTPPKVPANVGLVYNLYQPSALDGLPFFRGIALETETANAVNLQNVNMRKERRDLLNKDTDHFNIEKNEKVHAEVVKKVQEFCPPRDVWVSRMKNVIPNIRPSNVTQAPAPALTSPTPVQRVGTVNPPLERVP